MKTVHTEKHRLRASKTELNGGQLVPPFECPERVEHILAELAARRHGEIVAPDAFGLAPVRRIHDGAYLDFLSTCWEEWQAAGYAGEAIATTWPSRRMPLSRPPREIDGRIGYYCLAAETSISGGTWEAAQAAADVALTGQALVAGGARAAFALCRPPGHHAAQDMFGGYCFLNNAAIAAQAFRDQGAARVAVLDVDFHHGNGTQAIFYDRPDVLFLSLHGDPDEAFPYFLGAADETGTGAGEGFNVNYPLAPGTAYPAWAEALENALARIRAYGAEAVVVSLGLDTFKEDPISFFKLESADFTDYGRRIARLGLPTLFVLEGGYAVAEVGINTVNVLTGFEEEA
ncbi:histone deacetylase family protein [Paroceanicella profunda]|uniref:Histone deacetylase family protein n=1 Tax=Paroceanicella profunda TaxID=2579971 RepID=A0A5B8FWI1_9RHOB|nr:histone deacetylase family protein [Paroceanicella profunda]QDL90859.1 histone deacetylase family protein [Paroceanicella profunda]